MTEVQSSKQPLQIWDLMMAPLFQTPEEVAKQAVENDIHIFGRFFFSGRYM